MVQWDWDITQRQLHSANGVGFLASFPQLWNSSYHKPQGLCRHVIVLAPYGEYSWNSHAECVMSDQFTWVQILCSCYTQMFHFIFYVSTSPINPLILRLKSKESSPCSHVFRAGKLCTTSVRTCSHDQGSHQSLGSCTPHRRASVISMEINRQANTKRQQLLHKWETIT